MTPLFSTVIRRDERGACHIGLVRVGQNVFAVKSWQVKSVFSAPSLPPFRCSLDRLPYGCL